MKIRHGTWYETFSGHAVFVKKTKGEGRQPVEGFAIMFSGKPINTTWEADGMFEWAYRGTPSQRFDIKGRWPHAKPKWCEAKQRYLLPKELKLDGVMAYGF